MSRISLAVALAIAARSSVCGLTGGVRVPILLWRKADPLQSPGRRLLCTAWLQEEVRMPEPVGPDEEEPESV